MGGAVQHNVEYPLPATVDWEDAPNVPTADWQLAEQVVLKYSHFQLMKEYHANRAWAREE